MYPETGYKCKLQLLPYNCKVRLNAHVFFTYAKLNISAVVSIYAVLLPSFSVKIVEHVIQTTKVVISPACKGPQNDSFGAIFVESDEEGKTRGVGNNSHSIKRRWGEHRQRQNPQRRLTLKKVTESKKTGSGGSGELTELDETVLDILGRESANIEPVKVEDSNIVFGEEIIVTTTPSAEGKIIIILCK